MSSLHRTSLKSEALVSGNTYTEDLPRRQTAQQPVDPVSSGLTATDPGRELHVLVVLDRRPTMICQSPSAKDAKQFDHVPLHPCWLRLKADVKAHTEPTTRFFPLLLLLGGHIVN